MTQSSTITIHNTLTEIGRVWPFFENLVRIWELAPAVSQAVQLCLDELITNIISYGYDDGETGRDIIIRFTREDDQLDVVLMDDARPFNPLDMPDPDVTAALEDRRIGGLGIFFVRNMMDDVRYERIDGRNILTLRKRLGGAEAV